MTENNTPEKENPKKPEKLKSIGPKQAIMYWVAALVLVIIAILLLKYNQNNAEESEAQSSSSASVICEFSDCI